ncbi:MAG: nucleotidyltransferase domain-containing protein [Planctomycetes bacterium]|nr:nucleotidyltransferase domain-containing protein [Planctomycetota bacterium]
MKTPRTSDPVLNEIVNRLVATFSPDAVYLFGSRARGEGGPDSDYDLLVVVPDSSPREQRQARLAYQALRGTGVAADVLVWTRAAFDSRLHLRASLPATIVREGKLLYAA